MDSRDASVITRASVSQRKYSTDRILRQAELSARLEESRTLQTRRNQIAEDPDQDAPERPQHLQVRSLARADTTVSQFDIHPGRRLDSFSFAKAAGVDTSFTFVKDNKAKRAPTAALEDVERRAAITQRAETATLDLSAAHAHINRPLETAKPHHRVQSWLTRTKSVHDVEPSTTNGLYLAAALNATLGLGIIASKSPDWLRRKQIHILEYTDDESTSFVCDLRPPFRDTSSLRHHLLTVGSRSPRFADRKGLRIIHIRNNCEAFKFIDQAFVISSPEAHFGERSFQDWMQEDRDSRRTSNMTIRWRPAYDSNRRVICMAMGIDMGSADIVINSTKTEHKQQKVNRQSAQDDPARFRKRRVAIYMQRAPTNALPSPRVTQFDSHGQVFAEFAEQNNLVICEYSSDAWSEISSTPALRTLSPTSGLSASGPAAIVASAVNHIFQEITLKWQSQIAAIHQPFAELEDLIYGQPSDMTHSPLVWEWSKRLQTMLKLAVRHLKAIQTFQDDFALFAELEEKVEWLDDVLKDMLHTVDTIRNDYIEPLEHMIDLMYKSVTIRDSRLSLELGTSLWRLSWITFIFLPLTFLVGFFGMNVDTFENNVSIKWYFVALIPLVAIISSFWYCFNVFGSKIQDHRTSADSFPTTGNLTDMMRRASHDIQHKSRLRSRWTF